MTAALSGVRGVLLDLDGTVYQGGALVPGAAGAVAALRARLPVRFVTNTTTKSRAAVVERLRALGIPATPGDVVSPPALLGARLRASPAGRRAALFVTESALEDFADVEVDAERPHVVVVGDLGDGWTHARLNEAFRLVRGGAELVALSGTMYWQADDGLRLDAGAYAHLLGRAGGRAVTHVGKPAASFFHAACDSLGLEPGAVAMVGDDAETDVRAAQRAGLRGVLVQTGKYRPGDEAGDPPPDALVESIARLAEADGDGR